MGATTGTVNEAKFGRELQVVIEKITEMAPDIIVSASADGKHNRSSDTVLFDIKHIVH